MFYSPTCYIPRIAEKKSGVLSDKGRQDHTFFNIFHFSIDRQSKICYILINRLNTCVYYIYFALFYEFLNVTSLLNFINSRFNEIILIKENTEK